MRKLLIGTHNKGKILELKSLLKVLYFEIVSLDDIGITDDIEETGTTFEENAILKAKGYATQSGLLTLADDGGLEVDALNNRPGVLSDRYAPTRKERITKLLDELKDIPQDLRTAQFRLVVAIYNPDNDKLAIVEGVMECVIATEPRGDHGFGYDPLLFIPSLNKTTAELTIDQKNTISHRGKALRKARDILQKEFSQHV